MTASLAAILGFSAALVLWPWGRDWKIMRMLGSADAAERARGMEWAVRLAPTRPQLLSRLERTLDAAGQEDRLFGATAEVLNQLGRLDVPGRRGEHLDRYYTIGLAGEAADEASAPARLMRLHQLILGGRDNGYVREAASLASGDGSTQLRAASAVLAARLGDDQTLTQLLGDEEPAVRAAAAIDAALAGRTQTIPAVAAVFRQTTTAPDRVAAAYALARLAPARFAGDVTDAIIAACDRQQDELLEQLLAAAPLLGRQAAPAVLHVLRRASQRKAMPPAMAFVAAGKIGLAEARPFIRALVDELVARRQEELTVGEAVVLAAAVRAAGKLEMPAELFVKVVENLWHPDTPAMLLALEALGQRAKPDDPEAMKVLRQAADQTEMPIPAAAAAVALFKIAPPADGLQAVRGACRSEQWLAGDYVAWNLAQAGRAGHAGKVLPVAAAMLARNEHNEAVRSAGATLMAMLTRDTDQADQARRKIQAKLTGGAALGGERDPYVAESYRCALLILGRTELTDDVLGLLRSEGFPKRRLLTALLLSGQTQAFDHVLGAWRFDPAEADSYLVGTLTARVYATVVPDLPEIDIDAPPALRHWQVRLCRDFYLIHRREILDRIRP